MEHGDIPLNVTSTVTQFWTAHDEALFTQPVLTVITGLSAAYFERGRWGNYGPKFYKLRRLVRYKKKDVVAWLEKLPAGVHHASAVLSATEADEGLKDFNDMAALRGLEAGRRAIAGAKAPAGDERRPGNGAASEEFHGPDEAQIEAPRPWPILPDEALLGIVKDIVEVSTKSSEADPAAVLMTTLTFASAFIGADPFTWLGDTRHYTRLYTVIEPSA